MKSSNSSMSACRHCRHYTPQGRRGGHCSQLNISVESAWEACSLAIPPFTPTWENIEELMVWQQQALEALPIPAYQEEAITTVAAARSPHSLQPTTGLKALWM